MKTVLQVFLLFICPVYYSTAQTTDAAHSPASSGLFDSDEVLEIKLSGEMKKLIKDKSNDPLLYPLTFSYSVSGDDIISFPVEVRTRGNFRRLIGDCRYLPLLIQFSESGPHKTTLFADQKRLKLVVPCRDEEYVIKEWMTYKLHNLITPYSFRARLVKVTLDDLKSTETFWGFFLEEEDQMAARNEMLSLELTLRPEQVQRDAFLNMAVFQYMIGNTDWSIQYLQNIKLISPGKRSLPIPVPYDFDQCGLVSAPYARPAKALRMKSVRQRRYRGFCMNDPSPFVPILDHYKKLKDQVYDLYKNCAYMEADHIEDTIKYLDEFYSTINHAEKWKDEFAYPCDPRGTGNVVIKGLKG